MSPPPGPHTAGPRLRFGARTVFAAIMLVVAVPFGLLLLLVRDQWPPLLHLDSNASSSLHRYAVDHPGFVTAMQALSTLGSAPAWLAVFIPVTIFLIRRRLPRLAWFTALTAAASALINELVKAAVHRARPVLPDPVAHGSGLSFPSGHAQSAIVGYSVLLLIFLPILRGVRRYLTVTGAALMVAAIGFSRVALGVHYVSDVVAGYLLGAAWVAAMTAVFNSWPIEPARARRLIPDGADRTAMRDSEEPSP